MSRNGRGNVEHDSASKIKNALNNMPENVSRAINMAKEGNEIKDKEVIKKEIPQGIKDLTIFGRLSEDLDFGSYKFKISTLSAKQQKSIVKKLFSMSNDEKISNLKFLTLSEAVVSVNGAPLESLYFGDDDSLSPEEKRIEVLLELQAVIVDKLFTRYEEIARKSNELLSDGGLQDTLKN